MNEYFQRISSSYDALTDEYIARIYHELEHKPLDRDWLARLAAAVGNPGPICESCLRARACGEVPARAGCARAGYGSFTTHD